MCNGATDAAWLLSRSHMVQPATPQEPAGIVGMAAAERSDDEKGGGEATAGAGKELVVARVEERFVLIVGVTGRAEMDAAAVGC